jgi:hypothetical protein
MSEKITAVALGLSYQPWHLRRHVVTFLVDGQAVAVRRFWTLRRAEAWFEAMCGKEEA